MKTRVLIGYDGSECANAAIEDLRRAGLPTNAEAIVLAVADPRTEMALPETAVLMTPPAIVREVREREAQATDRWHATARAGAERLRAIFPGWEITGDAVIDSPWQILAARAQDWQADVLVVGSHGRSAIQRLILGSVSLKVLGHALCSVRIGRCRAIPDSLPRPIRVVLGVDGSAAAATAVRWVAARPWPSGTEILAVTAVESTQAAMLAWPGCRLGPACEDGDSGIDRHARSAAQELRQAGLSSVPVLREGDPAHVLVAEAERWEADCIVLGAQGHSGLERLLHRSVSAIVSAKAHCSVEVVRLTRRNRAVLGGCAA